MRKTVLERTKGISSFLQNGADSSLDLSINPEKSFKLMLFRVPRNTFSRIPNISIESLEEQLKLVSSCKDLGQVLYPRLSFK